MMKWNDRVQREIEEDLKNIEAGVEAIRKGLHMRSTTQVKLSVGFVEHWAKMVKKDLAFYGHQ